MFIVFYAHIKIKNNLSLFDSNSNFVPIRVTVLHYRFLHRYSQSVHCFVFYQPRLLHVQIPV